DQLPIGEAALVEWQPVLPPLGKAEEDGSVKLVRARGRVLLFTSTVNKDWTVWPACGSFVPLMNEMLAFAVSGRLRGESWTVGEPLEEFLPIAGGGLAVQMQTPDSRTESLQ